METPMAQVQVTILLCAMWNGDEVSKTEIN